jgi:hypothetical protein
MADELQDSFKQAVGDRLKSHFFFGFAVAWLAFHARAIYITLFLDTKDLPFIDENYDIRYVNKLAYIDDLGYSWLDHWLGPLAVALLASILVHYVDELVIKPLKLKGTNWGVRCRAYLAQATVYTKEQMDEVIAEASSAEKMWSEEKNLRQAAEERVDSLKESVRALRQKREEKHGRRELEVRDLLAQLASARNGAEDLQRELDLVKQANDNLGKQLQQKHTDERAVVLGQAYYGFVSDNVPDMLKRLRSLSVGNPEIGSVVNLLEELQGVFDRVSLQAKK